MEAFTGVAVDVLMWEMETRRRSVASVLPTVVGALNQVQQRQSYSSVKSDSTDDDEELAKIVDPDELEARVLENPCVSSAAQRSGVMQRPIF